MILGHIDNISKELAFYPPAIKKGLAYLRAADFSGVSNGKHIIDGEKMHVVVSEYATSPVDDRKAETHERYIDVQYIIEGSEMMGFSSDGSGEVQENLLAEKDAVFYRNVRNEKFVQLEKGMFAIFFPWDIHRPGCMSQAPANVRKAVLKIAMEALA
ncbi:MAG TPA: YhcH/YjgK/YiaL family protein [Selenomonadales bacterium]|nr:YhcH/YjgK/YiaL family protein [Selenomonadales bacterium]